jgi:hypothetical protein
MGIAKSIEGYFVFSDYTVDKVSFIHTLSDKLNADFNISTYDKEYEPMHEENQLTNFGKQTIYNLIIIYDDYKVNGEKVQLPTYELAIPINYVFEDTLELMFYPSKAVRVMFLTFEHLWGIFIDTLKFKYSSRSLVIDRYDRLRKEYSKVLQALGAPAIFIVTDAHYHIEDLDNIEEYPMLNFSDIPQIANQKDHITTFEFDKILYARNVNELEAGFLKKSDLEIAFVDKLKFE